MASSIPILCIELMIQFMSLIFAVSIHRVTRSFRFWVLFGSPRGGARVPGQLICYCPIRGYFEELLAVDKRPMRGDHFLLSQKLGRAPKRLLSRLGLVSSPLTFVMGLQTIAPHAAKSAYSAWIYIYLLLFCDGVIFGSSLLLLGVHTFETLENVTNSERPYTGESFELQLLSHVPSEMQIGEANVAFAGEVKQKWMTSKAM